MGWAAGTNASPGPPHHRATTGLSTDAAGDDEPFGFCH